MNSLHVQQVMALYHALCECPAEGRTALLDAAEPALRREVESLLAQDTGSDFLERSLAPVAMTLLAESAPPVLAEGSMLGPYCIERWLGAGGMGEVYRAVDTRLGRAVAIKRMRERFSAWFLGEARAIAALNHPNICALYDIGPDYMVMELVEGDTLAARIAQGPLPHAEALACAAQILAGLAAAHAKGVVHRDLKPGNIMLSAPGIKLLDFGLARFSADDAGTATGNAMGTPDYIAPEQRSGQPADPRSDLYSFGCVLHEMLVGGRAGVARRPLSSRRLDAIVARCLHENPAQRWQSATELAEALGAIPVASASRWRSTPVRWIALACGLALAGLAIGGWMRLRPPMRLLTDRDTLVLAEFDNRTGDAVFDDTLRLGLSVQLEQSPFLAFVSEGRVRQALVMMGRSVDARLVPGVARDLCQRVGARAVVTGAIAQVGTPYQITLRALDCATGDTIASTEVDAPDKNQVLASLGTASARLREQLGEALASVRRTDVPLEQATTSSLEALKAYSVGMRTLWTGKDPLAAIPLFQRAIELDPDFALAYGVLTIEYTNLGESRIAADYARRAYALREHVSEPERYFITARYGRSGTGDIDLAAQACRTWLQAYPRAAMPHILLAGSILPVQGDFEQAAAHGRQAIRMVPANAVPYALLMDNYIALDRFDAAHAIDMQARRSGLQSLLFAIDRYQLAFLRQDAAGMAQQLAATRGQAGFEDQLLAASAETAAYEGRLGDARRLSQQAIDAAAHAGGQEPVAAYLAMAAVREALYGYPAEAQQSAQRALEQVPARDVLFGAAFAFAMSGAEARAETLVSQLASQYPEDTLVQRNYLPTLRAQLALAHGDATDALAQLRSSGRFELGVTRSSQLGWASLYSIYVRGESYLAARDYPQAAGEFRKILAHRGLAMNYPVAPMARLHLAEALAGAGDRTAAVAAYSELLGLWRHADPDLPVLQRAQTGLVQLH
ncbi:MAG: protein kinase [Xanthomonadaceae bacterium]|nr:protein kinase [Xanthomonadaceae bacterium]